MIIKVCGLREAANIREVEVAGATWCGFIFYEKSKRCVTSVPDYLPTHAKRVGVFVNASPEEIAEKVTTYGLDLVQLHGNESPETCRAVAEMCQAKGGTIAIGSQAKGGTIAIDSQAKSGTIAIVKAFGVDEAFDFSITEAYASVCQYFLFDTACAGHGGSGEAFSWKLLSRYTGATPFLLSGGIGSESIAALRAFTHPACVGIDLNSRFELAPGLKDAAALKTFISSLK